MADLLKENLDYLIFMCMVGALFAGASWVLKRRLLAHGLDKPVSGMHFHIGRLPQVTAVLVAAIFIIGWFIVDKAGNDQWVKNKKLIEGIAPTFSYELQKMGHNRIRIATSHEDGMYLDMLTTVEKWMAINPDIERIYTLRKLPSGTHVYVIAPKTRQSGPMARSAQATLPIGEPYLRGGHDLEEAFDGTETFTENPEEDNGKRILSSYVPIYDPSGRTDGVLGIDFDAAKWQAKIYLARTYVMVFLFVLFIPVIAMYWVVYHNRMEKFRMRLHQLELSESEDRFRKLSHATFEGIIIAEQGIIREVNQTFATMFGYKQWEMLGLNVLDLVADDTSREEIRENMISEHDTSYEAVGIRKDGTLFATEVVGTHCQYQGRSARVIAVRDITERKRSEETINRMAYHDTLTGLPNRLLFHDRVELALRQASFHHKQAAILFLDLDRFKLVNDTLGHAMGDKLLKEVAERLSCCVREEDLVARMGGDEFTVLLRNIESEREAVRVSETIIETLRQPFLIDEYELHTTTSIGITIYPQDGDDVQMLMKNADTAMYRAKDQGRNNYSFYSPAMNQLGVERLELENGLRYALQRGELVVYYQPRMKTEGGIAGMEALIRWNHPTLGLVPPGKFIPLAEETGLIVPIGEWVLETACRQNKAWQMAGYPPMQIAVNLSARQFQSSGLVERIQQILADTGLDPQHLELEITESITMQDVDFTIATLQELSRMGVHISIDDFGTGYSSLNYLKHFPVNTLKIDQSFVRELTPDSYNAAIVTTVIHLAQELKLKTVAEGVETEAQREFLEAHLCDELQGFLFSRPVPAPAFEEFMKSTLFTNL